ncbi:hypothetical protein RR46_12268 [Papilio xuthus]|uniref:Uncharacterized protein n=1 Tax=Papilio xuthus TaxID=66420 RepID=A0A194PTD7_PAPXU|nr:hypothetical protein RR46_12268 [Papilio xuthus]
MHSGKSEARPAPCPSAHCRLTVACSVRAGGRAAAVWRHCGDTMAAVWSTRRSALATTCGCCKIIQTLCASVDISIHKHLQTMSAKKPAEPRQGAQCAKCSVSKVRSVQYAKCSVYKVRNV